MDQKVAGVFEAVLQPCRRRYFVLVVFIDLVENVLAELLLAACTQQANCSTYICVRVWE